jgi:hypothetical protein
VRGTVAKFRGWVAKLWGWLPKLVARPLAAAANPDISQKSYMGDISKELANTLQPAKKTNTQKISTFPIFG